VRLPFNWVHMSSSLDKPSFQVRHIKSPAWPIYVHYETLPFNTSRISSNNAASRTRRSRRAQPYQGLWWQHSLIRYTFAYVGDGYRGGDVQRHDKWHQQEKGWL
jgi:hypothetical protein